MFFFFWWGARVTEGIGLHPALSSVALLKTQENWYLIDRGHATKYKLTLLDPAITNTKSTIWHSSQSTSSSKMNNHTTKEISTPHFNCWNTATLFHASSPRQWKLTSSKWNQNYNFNNRFTNAFRSCDSIYLRRFSWLWFPSNKRNFKINVFLTFFSFPPPPKTFSTKIYPTEEGFKLYYQQAKIGTWSTFK